MKSLDRASQPLHQRGLFYVRAEGQPPKKPATMEDLAGAFDTFKSRHEERYSRIENVLDEMSRGAAAAKLGHGGGNSLIAPEPEYSASFGTYFKKGIGEDEVRAANNEGHRAQIQAAMSEGDNSSGGYLTPTEWDRQINKALSVKSPMRRLANVKATGVHAYSTVWNKGGWGSGWVGETAARPATSSADLAILTFATGEIYANPAATQRLLDDVNFNAEQWIAGEVDDEFSRQEGLAFLSGNGINKPLGLLQYVPGGAGDGTHPGGNLDIATVTAEDAFTPDELVDFTYGLPAPYRQGASWLMSSQTAAYIAKLKDGQGNFIWRESMIAGQPSTLLGRPVEIDEGMAPVVAGRIPIAFGDFRAGYLINDRLGTRILRDPYTNKPFVHFYCTKRVGGGVADPKAIRLLKMAGVPAA